MTIVSRALSLMFSGLGTNDTIRHKIRAGVQQSRCSVEQVPSDGDWGTCPRGEQGGELMHAGHTRGDD